MEPLAASGAGASIRLATGGSAELSALLRDGRVLSAEVVSPNTEGSLLLAIARHTIPAESELLLDPGTRLLVRVEQEGEGLVLRILGPELGGEEMLITALRALVGRSPSLGELLGDLARILGTLKTAELAAELAPLTVRLGALLSGPKAGGESIRAWLATLGLGHEAALATHLGSRPDPARLEELRGSLKALLLRAESLLADREGAHGTLRQGVANALAGLETGQLLNLARERAGDPLVLAFPFHDGENWNTARLLVPARREREDAQSPGKSAEPGVARVTLGLELSRLGPVRADLALGPGSLAVRLLVTQVGVLRRIEENLAGLGSRLGDGQRGLQIRVCLGTPLEARRGFQPQDIRYLREHHLMNVAG